MFDPAHVDYSALTQTVSPADVRAFRDSTRAARRANPDIGTGLSTAIGVIIKVFVAGFFVVFIVMFISIVGVTFAGSSQGRALGALLPIFGFLIFGGIIGATILIVRFSSAGRWAKWLKLSRFAEANGLLYTSSASAPSYPGCIFGVGDSRRVSDHFVTPTGRFLDVGNYEYTTGSGKNRTTRHWGFVALQLDRNLPNMVLDSKANNGLFGSTNLPTTFSRDQVLSLEGDFDRYFTLYCPKEYEQDALYILTPDLMALLIDDASPFDVEIADSWLFIYSQTPFRMLSPATYQRLFRIVATVGTKAISQTARYADDRVASPSSNIVASAGHRLRHGTNVVALVVFVAFAAFWVLTVSGVLGR